MRHRHSLVPQPGERVWEAAKLRQQAETRPHYGPGPGIGKGMKHTHYVQFQQRSRADFGGEAING